MTDAEIVSQVRAGNTEAYSGLVERYRQALYGVAYHHLGNSDDAQDAAQSAFVLAYQRLEQLRDPSAFGAWLRQIAVSQCRMHQRRPTFAPIDDATPDNESLKRAENRTLVAQCLACLSEPSRLTMTLFYLHCYSLVEIAAFLNVPLTTVKSRLRNARARIRKEHWDMAEEMLKPLALSEDFVWQVMRRLDSGVVRSIAFSPDGVLLASGGLDGTIRLWDAVSGAIVRLWTGHARAVDELAFSPDCRTLASASRDRTIRLWDVASGQLRTTVTDGGRPSSLCYSPDGAHLAHTSMVLDTRYRVVSSRAVLRDAENGNITREIETCLHFAPPEMLPPASGTYRGYIFHIAFAPDGETLATCRSQDNGPQETQTFWGGGVSLWDTRTGAALMTLTVPDFMVKSIEFSPDGKTLAAACTQIERCAESDTDEGELIAGKVLLWRVADGVEIGSLGDAPGKAAQQAAFSPDGELLAVYYYDEPEHETRVFDWKTGALRQSFTQTGRCRCAIAFSPDGQTIAAGSGDENVTLWRLANSDTAAS